LFLVLRQFFAQSTGTSPLSTAEEACWRLLWDSVDLPIRGPRK